MADTPTTMEWLDAEPDTLSFTGDWRVVSCTWPEGRTVCDHISEADAKTIVHRWNSHPDLLAALRDLLSTTDAYLRATGLVSGVEASRRDLIEAGNAAERALSAASRKQEHQQ